MLTHEGIDICIIGSGVAGALIAAECTRRGRRVLVIEAGARFDRGRRGEQLEQFLATGRAWPYFRDERDQFVDTTPDFRYDLRGTRLKAVGGTTLHWGGVAQRLHSSDFRTRSLYGQGDDWPITYDDLEPYYARAERELGVAGEAAPGSDPRSTPFPMPGFPDAYSDHVWRAAANRIGVQLERVSYAKNSVPYAGRPACQGFATCGICPIGAQYSADVHIAEAEASGRCELLTETVARRIAVDAQGRVRAVYASGLDGREHEVVAPSVVVAAHAVESARLLLLSGLGNQGDQVGRRLMEHFYVAAAAHLPDRFYPRRVGYEILQCAAFYDGEERRHRGAIKLELGQGNDPLGSATAAEIWGKAVTEYDCREFGHHVGISAETEHLPYAESRVTLDSNLRDLFGDPVPHIHFHLGEFEERTRTRARAILDTVLAAAGAQEMDVVPGFRWGAHHMGTCRMGHDPESAVVDHDLQVFGTHNLYAVGSGNFPTGGALQPTLTIAALSLRLADRLAPVSV